MRLYRPVVRYQGGKFRIAKWIISFFPKHKIYCESFGGAASILMQKELSTTEVYNDNNSEIVNVFKILRDKNKAEELKRLIELTPYSRQEYYEAQTNDESDSDIEIARKTIVKAFMGISAGSITKLNGGFSTKFYKSDDYKCANLRAWQTYPDCIQLFCKRLKNVMLENKDGMEVIKIYDTPETLHYVDPPYVTSTWNKNDKKAYKTILTNEYHIKLLELLKTVQGYVFISGYDNEIYKDMLADWHKEQIETKNQNNNKRIETIWISPRTWNALNDQYSLLDIGGRKN